MGWRGGWNGRGLVRFLLPSQAWLGAGLLIYGRLWRILRIGGILLAGTLVYGWRTATRRHGRVVERGEQRGLNCTNAARRWLCTHREPCRLTPAITWLGYSTVCHMVFVHTVYPLRKDRCCGMHAGFTGRAAGAIPLHQNVLDLHSFVNPTAKQSSRVLFHPICREEKHEWPLRGPETSHKTDAQREVHVDPPNPEFGSWTIK